MVHLLFRSHVLHSAALAAQELGALLQVDLGRESEVDQSHQQPRLFLRVLAHQDVVWLQVSVHDVVEVQVLQSPGYLAHHVRHHALFRRRLFHVLRQSLPLDEFHDEVYVVLGLDYFPEGHNVFVIQLPHDLGFGDYQRNHLATHEFLLV